MTIKPWWRPRRRGSPQPAVKLDWADALRPRPLETIGVALEHNQDDGEILNRGPEPGPARRHPAHPDPRRRHADHAGLRPGDRKTARPGPTAVTSPTSSPHSSELGYRAHPVLLYGPDRAGEIVAIS